MASSRFFSDRRTPIDYVFVYNRSELSLTDVIKLETFLKQIIDIGFKVEIQDYSVDEQIDFIKVHAPDNIVCRYAFVCNVDLTFRSRDFRSFIQVPPSFMATPLTKPNPEDYVYKRNPQSVGSQIPRTVTSAERIMVMFRIMQRIKFGEEKSDYGFHKLVKDKILQDAFPLHDGQYQWTTTGFLNDRQLLSRYWANFGSWYKEQPLNLIEQYYGTEHAFYFAWFGFYAKMLIPIGLVGILCFLFGIVALKTEHNLRSQEICNSNITMCARCHFSTCTFGLLKDACTASYMTFVFDNNASIFMAVLTTFWSTIFMETWQRTEAKLQLQWRVEKLLFEDYLRPEYVEKADKMVYSPITKRNEPYVSFKTQFGRYCLSISAIILFITIIILLTIGIMVYRIAIAIVLMARMKTESLKHVPFIASATGALFTAVLIVMTHMFIPRISVGLTNLENHRTQREYDAAFIFKYYALSFANCYTTVFYIAFFKGRFFTHPGEMSQWTHLGGIGSDQCGPSGCITDLVLQLIFILVVKLVVKHLLQIILPIYTVYKRKKEIGKRDIPFYEQNYLLNPVDYTTLHGEYLDMVLQYGYVVFFTAAFPIAPTLAMVNNLIEIRTDSSKFLKSYRRPVPNRVTGVGAWFEILKVVTYLGVIINSLIIAFTSDFVPRHAYDKNETYSFIKSSLSGKKLFSIPTFFYSVSSEFARNDFIILRTEDNDSCYYRGQRFPPNHQNKYELTTEYWSKLSIRFFIVLLIEHIVFFLNGILAYAIPDVPADVKRKLQLEEKRKKQLKRRIYQQQNAKNYE